MININDYKGHPGVYKWTSPRGFWYIGQTKDLYKRHYQFLHNKEYSGTFINKEKAVYSDLSSWKYEVLADYNGDPDWEKKLDILEFQLAEPYVSNCLNMKNGGGELKKRLITEIWILNYISELFETNFNFYRDLIIYDCNDGVCQNLRKRQLNRRDSLNSIKNEYKDAYYALNDTNSRLLWEWCINFKQRFNANIEKKMDRIYDIIMDFEEDDMNWYEEYRLNKLKYITEIYPYSMYKKDYEKSHFISDKYYGISYVDYTHWNHDYPFPTEKDIIHPIYDNDSLYVTRRNSFVKET